jgi:serine/threonine protein kinase
VLRDAGALARFRREAQVQSRVRHPNVVTVHDFGEGAGSSVWMLLEFAGWFATR